MNMHVHSVPFTFTTNLSPVTCGKCGVVHAIPASLDDWSCPNGHKLHRDQRHEVSERLLEAERHVGIGRCPYCKKDFRRLDRHLKFNHLEEQGSA